MAHLPAELDLPDYDFFAWDALRPWPVARRPRRQPELRDQRARRADLPDHLSTTHAIEQTDMAVLAQSVVPC